MYWLSAFQPFSYFSDEVASTGAFATTWRQKKPMVSSAPLFESMPQVTKISGEPSLSKSWPSEAHAHRPISTPSLAPVSSKRPPPRLRYSELPLVWRWYAFASSELCWHGANALDDTIRRPQSLHMFET